MRTKRTNQSYKLINQKINEKVLLTKINNNY